MDREKYIMPASEIKALVAGFVQFGPEEMYNKMKSKALAIMEQSLTLDEEFMDRSETLLQKAREESIEEDSGVDEITMRDIFYTLAFLLRKLAHEIHFKLNKTEGSDRFLRVIVNEEAPTLLI